MDCRNGRPPEFLCYTDSWSQGGREGPGCTKSLTLTGASASYSPRPLSDLLAGLPLRLMFSQ